MRVHLSAVVCASLAAVGMARAEVTYKIDAAHSQIGFAIKHLVISKVRGHFTDYEATLVLDDNHQLVSAEATIQAASLDTGNEKRDEHLRNEDFFHVGEHPVITFKSKSVTPEAIVGDFTIRGVTKEVELLYELTGPITDPWGNTKIGFAAQITVNRKDYGLAWNNTMETGELVVGEEAELQIESEFTKQ